MFADDSNVFSSGSDLKQIESLLNSELPLLIDWLRANRLSLNIDKTHVMVFGPPRKRNLTPVNIQIEGRPLNIVTSTKFLGLILDSDLTWKDHIHHLTRKIAKSIGILSLAKQTLTQKSLIQLYYAFVHPYLSYCTIIWGKNHDTTIWPIFRLQKISIRIIGNIPRRTSTKPFCKENNLLLFPDIFTLSVATFMFNYSNSLLPPSFNNLFHENNTYHNYPSRNRNQLRPPRTRIKHATNFISNQGTMTWNLLKSTFDTGTSFNVFKRNTKLYLLSAY